METKKCKGPCGEIKPLDQFAKMVASKDGRQPLCRKCDKDRCTKYFDEHPLALWGSSQRKNSKVRGKPIKMTVQELVQWAEATPTCELTGLKLTYGRDNNGQRLRSTASVDHINPNIEGILENLGIIRDPFNMAKNAYSIQDLTNFIHNLYDNRSQLRLYMIHKVDEIELIPYKRQYNVGTNWRWKWADNVRRNHLDSKYRKSKKDVWDISRDYIYSVAINTDFCQMCNRRIYYAGEDSNRKGRQPDSASFDRIDTSKAYTIGNVGIICDQCNGFKGRGTLEELLEDLNAYLKHEDDLVADYQKRADALKRDYVKRGHIQGRLDMSYGSCLQLG